MGMPGMRGGGDEVTRAIDVKACRTCPMSGGGAVRRCNLATHLPLHDSDNQRDPGCPLNDGPVVVSGSDPGWLRKIKETR
jgi:hypothetical protein